MPKGSVFITLPVTTVAERYTNGPPESATDLPDTRGSQTGTSDAPDTCGPCEGISDVPNMHSAPPEGASDVPDKYDPWEGASDVPDIPGSWKGATDAPGTCTPFPPLGRLSDHLCTSTAFATVSLSFLLLPCWLPLRIIAEAAQCAWFPV